MLDLSSIDFTGLSRHEIAAALLEASSDAGHASFADEPEDGRGRLAAYFADEENDSVGGHWVTMEGQHLFVGKAGEILKGPAHLVGKKVGDLPARSSGGEKDTHEKTLGEHLNEARAAHKAAVEAAHAAGKPVSDKVLKDYPHLGGGKPAKEAAPVDHAAVDHAKATKELYDSMGRGSAAHGGTEAAHAKIEAYAAELSKLSADKVKESLAAMGLRGGSSKPENLALIKRAMMDRMGTYDRVNGQKGHPLI